MAEFYRFPQWVLTALVMVAAACIVLQTLSICAALPIMVIICIIVAGFLRQLRHHGEEETKKSSHS